MRKILRFVENYRAMPEFLNVIVNIGEPVSDGELNEFASTLSLMNDSSRRAITALYKNSKELSLSFDHVSGKKPRFGGINLFPCSGVLFNIGYNKDGQTAFDRMVDDTLITIRIEDGDIRLSIEIADSPQHVPMGISLDEYVKLLDEARGLFPWQWAVASKQAGKMDETRSRFLEDLRIVFPDADLSLF